VSPGVLVLQRDKTQEFGSAHDAIGVAIMWRTVRRRDGEGKGRYRQLDPQTMLHQAARSSSRRAMRYGPRTWSEGQEPIAPEVALNAQGPVDVTTSPCPRPTSSAKELLAAASRRRVRDDRARRGRLRCPPDDAWPGAWRWAGATYLERERGGRALG